MHAVIERGTIDHDTVRGFFPGLEGLVDFQRKFSLDCEEQYLLPWEEQRWGKCITLNVQFLADISGVGASHELSRKPTLQCMNRYVRPMLAQENSYP